jgi:hypothetical protein
MEQDVNALRIWWVAVRSGWKAARKQYRKRLTELRDIASGARKV